MKVCSSQNPFARPISAMRSTDLHECVKALCRSCLSQRAVGKPAQITGEFSTTPALYSSWRGERHRAQPFEVVVWCSLVLGLVLGVFSAPALSLSPATTNQRSSARCPAHKRIGKKLRIPHNRSFSHIRKGERDENTKKHSGREALDWRRPRCFFPCWRLLPAIKSSALVTI